METPMTSETSRLLDTVLTSTGALAALTMVFFANQVSQQVQFIVVVVGLMCASAAIYGATVRLIPGERKFSVL